jgi:cytochrome c-type biogenesis protein CcmH/NrfG
MSESAIAAARRYVEVGQPERALETLATLDADAARTSTAISLRGYAHLACDRPARSAEVARDGLAEDPHELSLLLLLSLSEEQLGNLGRAEAAILAALEVAPEDPQLLCQYADVLMHGRQLDKAERILGVVASVDPDSPDLLGSRINLAYLRHDRKRVEALSRELLAYDPESIRAHRMLGAVALERGRADFAAERFGEAVRGAPEIESSAELARHSRTLTHPFYWPLLFFDRVGAGASWIGAMALIFGTRAAGLGAVAGFMTLGWIVLCVWSWIASWALKRKVGR